MNLKLYDLYYVQFGVTLLVSYKRQELLTVRDHAPVFTSGFSAVHVAYLFSFLWCFVLSLSRVLCTQCYQCLWIVHFWLHLLFSQTFIGFAYIVVVLNGLDIITCLLCVHYI